MMTPDQMSGNLSFADRAIGAVKELFVSRKAAAGQSAKISDLFGEIAKLSPDDALAKLETNPDGLTEEEAEKRGEIHGKNQVAREDRKSIIEQIIRLVLNPLNIMLLVLAIINFVFLGDFESGGVVSLMVIISVTLSFVQENRSNNAAEKLRAMVSTTASVLRQETPTEEAKDEPAVAEPPPTGRDLRKSLRLELPIVDLVPGDIVWLSAGDIIPADVRILSARDLFLNQSALTGESMPIEKFPTEAPLPPLGGRGNPACSEVTNFLELTNIAFMGSHVTSGTAKAVVVATGAQTYFGSLARSIVGRRTLTSFEKGVNRFTWLMIRFMLVMVPLVFLINGYTKHNWMEAFIFAMSVAVGLTPEMLPMIVTVNLSKGALAMSRKKVIVKRLNSIQNFGAMDVLCTDKTGTLTQDKVIMKKSVDLQGEENDTVLNYAFLNSFYQSGLKNLLDVAVLAEADLRKDLHIDEQAYAKIDEIPFDFVRRRMSVVVSNNATKQHILICKGAVEEILHACSKGEVNGQTFTMTSAHHADTLRMAQDLNEDGFRVIAVAHKDMPPEQATYGVADECDMTLIGFIAFLDPPKESAAPAIAALEGHGIKVKILTGDNDIVALRICKDVNLTVEGVLLGSDLTNMTDEALDMKVEHTTLFAKLSPAQKARVIASLHRGDHVVGFLGDGINDGPALKAADVGISVDTAADIAKESADIILLEKSLMVLEEGVLEGRKVFSNITKYIKMGASSNFGNMFSVLGASALLPFLPMLPIQVLANNLLYDFSQTTIPTDNVDEEYLTEPRRWDIAHIAKFMIFLGPISSIFDYVTYAVMWFGFGANSLASAPLFQTAWFVESILTQTLIIHIIRTNKIPFIQSRASWPLILTTITICTIGIALPFSYVAHSLGFVALPWTFWPVVAAIIGAYLALTHVVKVWFIKKFGWN
ncbi:MAG: magnesium-translocating P-type ATPase [Alphaproteobacteria bacterium]|nr:magnesium-translocating P-type ATPase [Alphaproteobacteria bacterium]